MQSIIESTKFGKFKCSSVETISCCYFSLTLADHQIGAGLSAGPTPKCAGTDLSTTQVLFESPVKAVTIEDAGAKLTLTVTSFVTVVATPPAP